MVGTFWICVHLILVGILHVVAGVENLRMPSREIRRVGKIYVHPDYRRRGGNKCLLQTFNCLFKSYQRIRKSKTDIAVLTLTEGLPLGNCITSVNLPNDDALPYCRTAKFAGWGETENGKDNQLRYIDLIILSPEESTELEIPHRENEFHAQSDTRNSHANSGDHGSPLVEENIVYGITSSAACSSGGVIVFTEVFNHLDFIRNAMSDADDSYELFDFDIPEY